MAGATTTCGGCANGRYYEGSLDRRLCEVGRYAPFATRQGLL
jgi:hypothetical protein